MNQVELYKTSSRLNQEALQNKIFKLQKEINQLEQLGNSKTNNPLDLNSSINCEQYSHLSNVQLQNMINSKTNSLNNKNEQLETLNQQIEDTKEAIDDWKGLENQVYGNKPENKKLKELQDKINSIEKSLLTLQDKKAELLARQNMIQNAENKYKQMSSAYFNMKTIEDEKKELEDMYVTLNARVRRLIQEKEEQIANYKNQVDRLMQNISQESGWTIPTNILNPNYHNQWSWRSEDLLKFLGKQKKEADQLDLDIETIESNRSQLFNLKIQLAQEQANSKLSNTNRENSIESQFIKEEKLNLQNYEKTKVNLNTEIKLLQKEINGLLNCLAERSNVKEPTSTQKNSKYKWIMKEGWPKKNPQNIAFSQKWNDFYYNTTTISFSSITSKQFWGNSTDVFYDWNFNVTIDGDIPDVLYAKDPFSIYISGKASGAVRAHGIGMTVGVVVKGIDLTLDPPPNSGGKHTIFIGNNSRGNYTGSDQQTYNFKVPKNPSDELKLQIFLGGVGVALEYIWVKQ